MADQDNNWRLRAKCRGKWELFDAVESVDGKPYYPHLAQAREICASCPVWNECFDVSRDERTGIWAGQPL